MKPTYKIIIDNFDVNLTNRLISLQVTDESGITNDTCEITLDDRDSLISMPRAGSILRVHLGYEETGLSYIGSYVVNEITISGAPNIMRIKCHGADLKTSLKEKISGNFDGVTIKSLVETIASKHGLTAKVSDEFSNVLIDYVAQTNESDMHFLTRLANKYGGIAKPANGSLLFAKRGLAKSISGLLLGVSEINLSDVISWSMTESVRENYWKVESEYVDFKDSDGLQKLGNTLKQMSRSIPISAEGLAQITASGGQLGIKENNLAAFTDTVAKMSTAFNMMPEEAGEAMAQMSNVFQIPITNMKNLGDAINNISDNMAAKAKDIVPALNRAGGSVRQFGLSAEQAAALCATLIAMGQMPEKAGTAVSAILTKLQTAEKQGPKFKNALKEIGLSASSLSKEISTNAQGALLTFFGAVEKMNSQKRAGILVDIFGMEYQKEAALIVGSLNTYRQAISLVADKTAYAGSMQREFANRSATTANNFQLLKNAITETGMNIGTVLLPPINNVVNVLRSLTESIATFAVQNPSLTKGIIGIATALVACKVAGLAFGYIWTFIKGGMLAVMTVWQSLSLVFATNPITASIVALGLAATLIIANWTKVKEFFTNIWEEVKPIWEKFANWVSEFWDTISAPFKAIGGLFSKFFGGDKNVELKKSEVIKQMANEPFKNSTPITNKTQTNHFKINVDASNSTNPKEIAAEIKKAIESRDNGALYDFVGAY